MKHWHVTVIAVSVFLLLLGCNLGSSTPSGQSAPTPTAAPATTPTAPAAAQPVKVSLTWDKPVDMDLEIWDSYGQQWQFDASKYCGNDVATGGEAEWIEFKQYGAEDFRAGKYVIVVGFWDMAGKGVSEAMAKLNITLPDGQSVSRQRKIIYEPNKLWKAFRIDAATGAIEDLDEMITVNRPH